MRSPPHDVAVSGSPNPIYIVKRTLAEKIVRQQGHRVRHILTGEAAETLDRLRARSREL